ncbi:hypothetical protein [Orrella marina]|nr:hypothetical protein [Orrella marina]
MVDDHDAHDATGAPGRLWDGMVQSPEWALNLQVTRIPDPE